jgi:hypothetical protein
MAAGFGGNTVVVIQCTGKHLKLWMEINLYQLKVKRKNMATTRNTEV